MLINDNDISIRPNSLERLSTPKKKKKKNFPRRKRTP